MKRGCRHNIEENLLSTIFHCLKRRSNADSYHPKSESLYLAYYGKSEKDAIKWLEKNDGGVYKNILHNFSFEVKGENSCK